MMDRYYVVNKKSGGVIATMPTFKSAQRLAKLTNAKNKGTAAVVNTRPKNKAER